jgi:hypothetical protein
VTGGGSDDVSIAGTTSRIQLTVDTGAGDDFVNVNWSRFGRKTSLQGGDGYDRLATSDNKFARQPAVVGFESVSAVPVHRPAPTPTPNTPPVANPATVTVVQGQSLNINLAASAFDAEGRLNPASVAITQPPAHGTAIPNGDGTVTYTHDGSATTTDSMRYAIQDLDGAVSNEATVTITITPSTAVTPPIAESDSATVVEGGSVTIDVAANDFAIDGRLNLSSIRIIRNPTRGTATPNGDGTVTYTHDGSATATDSFQYAIRDQQGSLSNAAVVTITIVPAPVNQPPVANDDAATVSQGSSVIVDVAANDTDPEDQLDSANVTITQPPAHGTATANGDGTVTYVHDGSDNAADDFHYTVRDAQGAVSNEATVTITVTITPANQPPVANDDDATVTHGQSVVINVLANDTDDDVLDAGSVVITQLPANGTAVANADGTVSYSHDGSDTATDSFRYVVRDTRGGVSNEATVSISVTPIAVPAVANPDEATVNRGGTVIIDVAANDVDARGQIDRSSVVITQPPVSGTATVNADGTVTYAHNDSDSAEDVFRYTIRNTQGSASNEAVVMITIMPEG